MKGKKMSIKILRCSVRMQKKKNPTLTTCLLFTTHTFFFHSCGAVEEKKKYHMFSNFLNENKKHMTSLLRESQKLAVTRGEKKSALDCGLLITGNNDSLLFSLCTDSVYFPPSKFPPAFLPPVPQIRK